MTLVAVLSGGVSAIIGRYLPNKGVVSWIR